MDEEGGSGGGGHVTTEEWLEMQGSWLYRWRKRTTGQGMWLEDGLEPPERNSSMLISAQ